MTSIETNEMPGFDSCPQFSSQELEALMDFDTLAERKKFADDLLQLFKSNTQLSLQKLKTAYEAADWNEVVKEAHKFKSGCFAMGAERLGKLSGEIEKRAVNASERPEDAAVVKTCLELLEANSEATVQKIAGFVSALK